MSNTKYRLQMNTNSGKPKATRRKYRR